MDWLHLATLSARPVAALPGGRQCALCEARLLRFLPYRGGSWLLPPLMRALEVVGSDVDNFECPRCGCHDRERHLFLYMSRAGLLDDLSGKTVVHFAPERGLTPRIAAAKPARHVLCDIVPGPGVQAEDLHRTSFETGSVDLLIANHVLEHVACDRAAVREIARILKPGGFAILQTPFSPVLAETWDDPGIATEAVRLQAYGQEDHVRLFGRDIFERIASAGLASLVRSHAEALPAVDAEMAGVNPSEPFFLFRRA